MLAFTKNLCLYIYKSVGGCRRVGSLKASPYQHYKWKNQNVRWGRVNIGSDFIFHRVWGNGLPSETVRAESDK